MSEGDSDILEENNAVLKQVYFFKHVLVRFVFFFPFFSSRHEN